MMARARACSRSGWNAVAFCGHRLRIHQVTERLAEAGIEPSVSSVGDSYDNALAETINGLYTAEVIHRRRPGAASRLLSSQRWNGSTDSTTGGSSSRSATFRPPKLSNATTPCWNNRLWRHNLKQTASGNPARFILKCQDAAPLAALGQLLVQSGLSRQY